MVTLADVVKILKEILEVTKKVEEHTKAIEELQKGQGIIFKKLENLEYGQKEILTRLNVWERLTKLEETVAKLEEKVKA